MSINKLQFERLNIIHDLLQKNGKYSVDELVEELKHRLSTIKDTSGYEIGISRRTLISDIKYLRSKGAPIPEKSKKYSYTESFSFLEVLGTNDTLLLDELKGIVGKLQAFNKINDLMNVNFDEIALRISDSSSKIVMFDNPIENLENADLLPKFLNFIQKEQVISIRYQNFQNQKFEDTFHPYLLKEYNGRWYIFGLSETEYEKTGSKQIFQYPIDRIRDSNPILKPKLAYFKSDWWNAENHFKDMIGVTKKDGQKPEKIVLRVYGNSVDYMMSKVLHHSQRAILEEDEYTDFEFFVIDNYEFRSKILALGSNAEVLEPSELRKSFAEITTKMRKRYLK
ncbi:WYL domain-containing transcriptional regulator [Emticicia sp. W12TSBA100-4]|uniref:helix-turn-helix transcriptional regulator n=1 Tax=Emticicia sp. W12TSBA100-4 TaxID=3160965 RepID=UPI0033056AC8